MINVGDRARDVLIVLAAVAWAFVVYASWEGALSKNHPLIYYGLLVCAVLTVIYYLMGAVINEKMTASTLVYPVLLNGALQAVAFTMIYLTKGQKMDFILGMHPGFFGAMVFFWLGSFLTSTLSYPTFFEKHVLPEEKWQAFLREVHENQGPPEARREKHG